MVLAVWMLLSGTGIAQPAGRLEEALNDLRSRPVACAPQYLKAGS